MKKILTISLLMSSLAFTSCKFEVEDYFDKDANIRLEQTCQDINNNLVAGSADDQHGWLLQYFVSGTSSAQFEGFNLFARFRRNGTALLASDHRYLRDGNAGKYTEALSVYDILTEDGPVLAFNTWNDVLTPFVDPVDPLMAPESVEKDGVGMGGDMNLVVTSYSDNEIQLRGERNGSRSRLVRCDRPWEQYIKDTQALKERITSENVTDYYVTDGNDTMYISGLASGCYTYADDLVNPGDSRTRSCVFTPSGFRIESADYVGRSSFQEFNLSDDGKMLISDDGKVQCHAMWDSYFVNKGLWIIDNTTLSDVQKSLVGEIETMVKSQFPTLSFRGVALGTSKGRDAVRGLVLVFYKNSARTICVSAGIHCNIALAAPEEASVSLSDGSCDYNMNMLIQKLPDLKTLASRLVTHFNDIYSLSADDNFNPSVVTLVNANGHKYTAVKDNNRIVIE